MMPISELALLCSSQKSHLGLDSVPRLEEQRLQLHCIGMGNSGTDFTAGKAAKGKGVAVVAAVEGIGSVFVSVSQGRGDAIAAVGGGRGDVVTPLGRGNGGLSAGRGSGGLSAGRGNGGLSTGRGNRGLSIGNAAESSAVGGRDTVPVVGSASGFAAGVAGDSRPSRGLEVPLPVPNPTIGAVGYIKNIWCHGLPIMGNGWDCGYCNVSKHGGGATRFKDYVAGIGGDCYACLNAPYHVVRVFRELILNGKDKRRKTKEVKRRVQEEINHGNNNYTPIHVSDDEFDEFHVSGIKGSRGNSVSGSNSHGLTGGGSSSHGHIGGVSSSHGHTGGVKSYFDGDLTYAKSRPQQTLEVCLKKTEYVGRLGKAWSKWFHANDISGHKANCPYFVGALKLTQDLGKRVAAPKGSEIDRSYLLSNYEELQQYVSKFKDDWATYGVTVMSDSWTGPSRMSIINFMVFSNGRMYFHKSVNATGNIQNSQFVYDHIKEVIVNEIGHQHVVQIVTDNGSNFKKASLNLIAEYPHITWQPCAAHTINLMLKEIGCFPEIDAVVSSAKRMSRLFYNHSTLHAEMKIQIAGELVRPNATRFGTVFMFLQSFWDKQKRFKVWMTSPEWANSSWSGEADYDYTYDCLTSRYWWDNVKWVLDVVRPLYIILRYADSQKLALLSGFMPRMMNARHELSSLLEEGTVDHDKYLNVVDKRVDYLYKDTLMVAEVLLILPWFVKQPCPCPQLSGG